MAFINYSETNSIRRFFDTHTNDLFIFKHSKIVWVETRDFIFYLTTTWDRYKIQIKKQVYHFPLNDGNNFENKKGQIIK